jgi:hypothetical protein
VAGLIIFKAGAAIEVNGNAPVAVKASSDLRKSLRRM